MVCHKPFEFHTVRPYEGSAAVIILCFETELGDMEYFNNKILSVNQRQKQYLNDIANMGRKVFLPKEPLDISEDGGMDPAPLASHREKQFIKNTIELLILSLLDGDATEKQSRISLYEQYSQRKTLTEQIIGYLKENMAEEIRLESISKRFSYSLSSIKRIFKEETGCSIISYLNDLRMKKAKELLRDRRLPIAEIALKVGFANVYYFSNAFKKKWGVSPSKYRALS
jgi:AraC-like DNA-binding protein